MGGFVGYYFLRRPHNPSINPSYSIKGTIFKIDGNALFVNKYKIKITSDTNIFGSVFALPYLLRKDVSSQAKRLNASDLKAGMSVSINTVVNPDDENVKEIGADSIQIQQIKTTLFGKITSVKNDMINLKAYLPKDSVTPGEIARLIDQHVEKDYKIKLSSGIKIYRQLSTDKEIKVEEISASSLKPDMMIAVYAEEEIKDQTELTAKYIEIVPFVPPLVPQGKQGKL